MRSCICLLLVVVVGGCKSEKTASQPDLATATGDLSVLGDADFAVGDDDLGNTPGDDLATDVDLMPLPIPTTTLTFTEQAGDVLNPERGWFGYTGIGGSFSKLRVPDDADATPPTTVATVKMDLDQDLVDIPAGTLTALVNTAATARTRGVKFVLRPTYRMDDSSGAGIDPPTAAFIVKHVGQLGQTLRDEADVIMAVELGLLGPWGEFHSTPLVDNGDTWTDIVEAMLDELPASRTVLLRRPSYKAHYLGDGTPLTDLQQFDGSERSRIGHFNDCFLASTNADQGTYEPVASYITPDYDVDEWRAYGSTDTRFTFVGGETCGGANTRVDCTVGLADLTAFHWTFLGHGWYQPTVSPTGKLATCRDEITDRLGYRLVLEEATISESVRPGDTLQITVKVRNEGFAPPINERPVFAVLKSGATTYTAELTGTDVDPRRWAPGTTTTFTRKLGIPAAATAGNWTLALWLPDAAASIRARSEYAIRFVNQGTWSDTTGHNTLTTTLSIATTAVPNSATPDATFAP